MRSSSSSVVRIFIMSFLCFFVANNWDYTPIELINSFDTRNLQIAWGWSRVPVLRTLFYSFFHVQIYRFVLLLASRRASAPTSSLDNQTTVRIFWNRSQFHPIRKTDQLGKACLIN